MIHLSLLKVQYHTNKNLSITIHQKCFEIKLWKPFKQEKTLSLNLNTFNLKQNQQLNIIRDYIKIIQQKQQLNIKSNYSL